VPVNQEDPGLYQYPSSADDRLMGANIGAATGINHRTTAADDDVRLDRAFNTHRLAIVTALAAIEVATASVLALIARRARFGLRQCGSLGAGRGDVALRGHHRLMPEQFHQGVDADLGVGQFGREGVAQPVHKGAAGQPASLQAAAVFSRPTAGLVAQNGGRG
jgi:hypothetical protein